jgi:tetratricopeptide (TPR) repeat protein
MHICSSLVSDDTVRSEQYEQAQSLQLEGMFADAARAYESFLADWPDPSPEDDEPLEQLAAFNLAALYFRSGRLREARVCYARVARRGDATVRGHGLRAAIDIDRSLGDQVSAESLLDEVIDETLDEADEVQLLVTALHLRLELARAAGDEAIANQLRSRWTAGLAQRKDLATATGREVLSLASRGDWEQAEAPLEVVLESAGDEFAGAVLMQFAGMMAQAGRIDDALRRVREPRFASRLPQMTADLLLVAGRFEDALKAAEPLTYANDLQRRGEAQLSVATALAMLGRETESEDKLLTLAGEDAGEWSLRAWLRLGRTWRDRRPDDARDAYRNAMRGGPASAAAAEAARDLGVLMASEGQREEAETALLFAADAGDAEVAGSANVALGMLRTRRDDAEGAVAAFTLALTEGDRRARDIARRLLMMFHEIGAWSALEDGLHLPTVTVMLAKLDKTDPDDHVRLAGLRLSAVQTLNEREHPALAAALLGAASEDLLQVHPLTAAEAETALAAATRAYELDIDVFGEDSHLCVDAMRRLATAYAEQLSGDRRKNVEQGLRHGERAVELEALSPGTRGKTALLHNNLAKLHLANMAQHPATNAERAIEHFEAAVAIYETLSGPGNAMTLSTVGNLLSAFTGRSWGDAPAAQERAIALGEEYIELAHCRDAHEARLVLPLLVNLGNLYGERVKGDPLANSARNTELAERARETSDKIYGRDSIEGARVRLNLATAYDRTPEEDPRHSLVIPMLEDALMIAERHLRSVSGDLPALIMNTLANAYVNSAGDIDSPDGDTIHRGIELHRRAIESLLAHSSGQDRVLADLRGNLALSLMQWPGFENLDEAIALLEAAASAFTTADDAIARARIESHLATAYLSRDFAEEDIRSVRKAIDHGLRAR